MPYGPVDKLQVQSHTLILKTVHRNFMNCVLIFFARLPSMLPILEPSYVVDKIMDAVLSNQAVLYVPRATYLSAVLKR